MEIQVGGLRIAYERAGKGPPLVLLHGYVESFRMPDYADCLAGFIEGLGLERPHVGGLSFGGAVAIEFYRRYPTIPWSLILAGAYAGWAGSLPPEVVQQRLTQALSLADMPSERLVREMVPTMFSRSAPAGMIEFFATNMSAFHPIGFRAMAVAVAEADLRDVLPLIDIPTLLLSGDEDVRAPLDVAEALHASIRGSKLVILPGVGHVSTVEGADRFNDEVRAFLRSAA